MSANGFASISRWSDQNGMLTLEARRWTESVSQSVRPEDFYGADGENIGRAFATGMAEGVPVQMDGSYAVSEAIATVAMTTETLTVIGNGKITFTEDVGTGIAIVATYPTPVAVTSVTQTTRSFPGVGTTAGTATKITAAGHGCTVGDIIKIVSDNQISPQSAANRKQGEFCYVADVSGNDIYVAGPLMDTYSTTVRMVRVSTEARLFWDGLSFEAPPDQDWDMTTMLVRGFAFPRIRTAIGPGYNIGLNLQSCFMADVDIAGMEMLSRADSGNSLGYLMQDTASAFSQVNMRVVDARHGYTTSTTGATASDFVYKYGRTYGAVVKGVALGCSSAAFDVHSEAVDVTFEGISTGGAWNGEDASGIGVQLRGIRNRVIGGTDRGSVYGANFHAQVAGDGVDCEIIDYQYTGTGDGIRINFPSASNALTRPRVRGGTVRSSFDRSVALWKVNNAIIDDLLIAPTGSGTDTVGIYLGNDAKALVRRVTFDLANYTGTTFIAFAFDGALTGNDLTVESARVINGAGKFKAWFNGASTTGNVSLINRYSDATPSSGDIIGGGSLSSLKVLQGWKPYAYAVASLPSASVEGAGTIVWTTNGNTGAACPAISDGTNWKRIALGATVAAS